MFFKENVMPQTATDLVTPEAIDEAATRVYAVARHTPLELNERLSARYSAKIYLKREDQQVVRSYKLRGAYNLMATLSADERERGAVTASAGNHAQGVALAAAKLEIKTAIFVPSGTPPQKVSRVRYFGGQWVDVRMVGKTFDDSLKAAVEFAGASGGVFVHPFDDPRVIAGQGTVGKEIYDQLQGALDVVVVPIGGGGLASGVGVYLKAKLPTLQIFGVEPAGAAAMQHSIEAGHIVHLDHIDKFVDGAAVQAVGKLTFELVRSVVDDVLDVPEGKTCTTMVELYQNEGIVTEPAGALAASALDQLASKLTGKTVVVVISGSNNDLLRYPEILERSLAYEGLKHYFLVEFDQKPGQLREFVDQALGPDDDITRFEYIKKTNKESGAALIGIELTKQDDFAALTGRLHDLGINYTELKPGDLLHDYMV